MRSDASHSITMLKQKFDEIKRNINTIEQKQKEFFSHGLTEPKNFNLERNRPASVNRFSDTKAKETDRNDNLLKSLKDFETERYVLLRKIEDFKKENEDLKETNTNQEIRLKMLQIENQQLRYKLEKFENQEKRPQSCIRDSKSPPKKNRVAFSKELTSVYHIDDTAPPNKPSPRPIKPSTSPVPVRNSHQLQTPSPINKFYPEEYLARQRRMGLE